ncbi:MAG: thiol-activated cytolysin family protein [Bacteroidota bacterium]
MTLLRFPVLRPALVLAAALSLVLAGCDAADPDPGSGGPGAGDASVGAFIQGLSYDAEALLNTQPTTGAEPAGDSETETEQSGNETLTCVATPYSLRTNFSEVAILGNPGEIWPGALVEANQSLLDGIPQLARFERAPMKLLVDLPGIGAEGNVIVEDPDQGNVNAAVDEALDYWLTNLASSQNNRDGGYVNSGASTSEVQTAYSSEQVSLDIGLNVAWATGDVESQFSYNASSERQVVFASYKQVFYKVKYVIENGQRPEDVFAPSVSLNQVEATFNSSAPPAYVSEVSYGRIILFKMETSSSYQAADVEAAFRYASGASVTDGDLAATYEQILQESSVEVTVLGGNPGDYPSAFSSPSPGELAQVIEGENAIFSADNPGEPIAYAVKFLKDDSLAKLGYTTEYTARECSSAQTFDSVTVTLLRYRAVRDCDAGPGDFEFDVDVLNGGAREGGDSAGSQNSPLEIEAPGTEDINEEITFNAERRDGNTFAVKFSAKEWDEPPFGSPNTNDLNRSTTRTHVFGPTGWTNLADEPTQPITIRVRNDDTCIVELDYTAEVE